MPEKGVSPLIAAVLLIVISVSIAGLIFSWLNTFTATSARKVENKTTMAIDCSGAAIRIKDVYLQNGTNATLRVIVENTGYVNKLVLTDAQAYNTTGHNFTASNIPVTMNKGEIVSLLFTGASIQTCANFSSVRVSTDCGAIDDEFTRVPKGC